MAKKVYLKYEQLKSFENMSVLIPREKWYIVEGERKPSIECPSCGCGILGDSAPHRILKDGSVKASTVCQNERCNFHAYVKLEEWDGGEIF